MPPKPGQLSLYKPEYCAIVIREMKKGAAMQELPLYLGVCLDTIYEWRRVHPEFAEAVQQGKSFSQALWMRKGRLNLKNDKFNYTGWYMNMKNRFGWSDKQENINSHAVSVAKVKENQEIRKQFEKEY